MNTSTYNILAMLDKALVEQVKGLFAALKNEYILLVEVAENHSSKKELIELLEDLASCSPKVNTKITIGEGLSLRLLQNGVDKGIEFRAVPNGHEFTTLLLAILNLDGIGKNLPDATVTERILALKGKVHIKSYISLTCTNCPDVVQALNVMAFINPNITHEIIDGGINQEEVKAHKIQAVPTVMLGEEPLHVGRSSLGELLDKLEAKAGSEFKASTETKHYDVVVVGGGPAGGAAAIYSARKGLKVAIVAQQVGGQMVETVGIENMISVTKTTGAQLTADLKAHLADYPIDILENRMVDAVELVEGKKKLTTSLGETLLTPALIIATGASWRRLGVPGESQYIGAGVAFCAHCDGPFYKNKRVAVVGGGNSGLEAAIDLSAIATEVTVLEYLDELKGDQVLQDKIKETPNIKVIKSAQTLEVVGDGSKVIQLDFKHRADERKETIDLDGVFVQIGLKANSSVFADLVETNKFGEIVIDAHCRTNIPGVYAAGDVSVVPYKQIVIAMGEGSKAALSAFDDNMKGKLLSHA